MVERQAEGLSHIFRTTVHDGLVKAVEVTLTPDRDDGTLVFVGLDAGAEDQTAILRLCTIPAIVTIEDILLGSDCGEIRRLARLLRDEAKFVLRH